MDNSGGSHEHEMKTMEDRWERIVGILGSESFPDFLRAYWNGRNKLVRKSDLFKTIRREIQGKEAAFELIRELDIHAHIYAALRDPQADHWRKEQRQMLQQLKMFNVRQPLSLLMSAHESFSETPGDFDRILRAVCVISFRYNVICNMQTNEQERVYNEVATRISSGTSSVSHALDGLKKVYPEDARFKAAFADKELKTTSSRNKNVVRFILFAFEKHLSNKEYDPESNKYNIEHILPENPGEQWPDYDEHRDKKLIYRLANMTLMENKLNREAGNSSYATKCDAYKNSIFGITRKVSEEYTGWNADKIASRQNWMARQATTIWASVSNATEPAHPHPQRPQTNKTEQTKGGDTTSCANNHSAICALYLGPTKRLFYIALMFQREKFNGNCRTGKISLMSLMLLAETALKYQQHNY